VTDEGRARLVAQLQLEEGCRLRPYWDTTGHLTIGYGRNLTDNGITQDEANYLLAHDIDDAEGDLAAEYPWVATLDEVRQRVLVDLMFNLGAKTLRTFAPTLAHIKAGAYGEAARHLRASLWARQVGDGPGGVFDRADRLIAMLETGADPS
jgi:lysozyme